MIVLARSVELQLVVTHGVMLVMMSDEQMHFTSVAEHPVAAMVLPRHEVYTQDVSQNFSRDSE